MFFAARPLAAHPLPLEVVVYLDVQSSGIRAIALVPAAFLADARLPRREDGYLDLARLDGPMAGVAAYVARTLDLMVGGRQLPSPSATWTLSRQADAVAEDFQSAERRAAQPRPPADARINPDTMVVDLAFDYAVPAGVDPSGPRSLRVNDFKVANQRVQMRVAARSGDGPPRTIVTSGAARRIDLDPTLFEALALFARRGLDQLRVAGDLLLFLLVLAVARRPLKDALADFSAFAAGCAIALVAVLAVASTASLGPVYRAGAAAMLVVAALQNVTRPRSIWVHAIALAFGLFEGAVLGAIYAADAPLAGVHVVAGLVSYFFPIVAAALLFFLILRPLVDVAFASRLQERWAMLLLTAIPVHNGLHGILGIMRS